MLRLRLRPTASHTADHDPAPVDHMWLTCADDRRTHAVTDHDFRAGLQPGHGVYRTVCGRNAVAAALATPPGQICPACRVAAR